MDNKLQNPTPGGRNRLAYLSNCLSITRSILAAGDLRPLEQRRTSGGKAGNSTFATPGDVAGSDTRNLRGVMPNSPLNSLNQRGLLQRPQDQRRKRHAI